MPDLDAADIKRIAQEAALEYSLPIEIAGVVLSGHGSEYVEILVNIDGCASAPCQLAIGIFRNTTEAALRREIGTQLRRQLDDAATASKPKD